MRTTAVVIFLVRVKQKPEMLLAKDRDMIEAVSSDRSDQPLCESILPGRSSRKSGDPVCSSVQNIELVTKNEDFGVRHWNSPSDEPEELAIGLTINRFAR
jgi:hypothetical protein